VPAPLCVFNQFGDLERCALRHGNVHDADGWEDVLRPVLKRYSAEARPSITRRSVQADVAFALPALCVRLEAEAWDYAIRMKGNPKLHARIARLGRHARQAVSSSPRPRRRGRYSPACSP
jgi:hypothetical protein|tara:strand:+ start:15274 stop:15633 length:360 start_codon:yes stop_codon:yes gene_type:complete